MNDVEKCRELYPELSDLEIHFFDMKHKGFREEKMARRESRPVIYLYDENNFAFISFMLSENSSPYSFTGGRVTMNGEELPFDTVEATRLGYNLPYFYLRGSSSPFHPTQDDEDILNTNFNPQCKGCDFCFYGYRQEGVSNITPTQGIELVHADIGNLSGISEVAVVTGRFPNEEKLKTHLVEVVREARNIGFNGRVFYIGSQLVSPGAIREVLAETGGNFRYAYTLERFSERDKVMHGSKGRKDTDDILSDMAAITGEGVNDLQYTYLVGIENLDQFKRGAEAVKGYATPHISIFRKTGTGPNELSLAPDYRKLGPLYTCEIRRFYDNLYGRKMTGNNLANLWPFPRDRFNLDHYLDKVRGDNK